MIRLIVILVLLLPWRATAQDLPDWQHTSVNDQAGLLRPDDIRILDQALIALHGDSGIEGTIVTLANRAAHGGQDGLESFATRLFNHWGVGDAGRNDGFMVLVLQDDRETRIELGAGYPAAADAIARDIIARDMLPAFRAGRMSDGIRDGTLAVIDRIARPSATGRELQAPRRSIADWLVPAVVFGIFGLAFTGIARGIIARIRHARRPCPGCGGRGLIEEIEPVEALDAAGTPLPRQSVWSRCPHCGWQSPVSTRAAPSRGSRSRRGGFGGGRSSGGGASGRW